MSFSQIKPYFRARFLAVNPDYYEWTDAFNINNIPNSLTNKAWHMAFGTATRTTINQNCLRYLYPVTVNVFYKGYSTPSEAIDYANAQAELLLAEILKHSNRLGITGSSSSKIINVDSTNFSLNAIDESNDNIVRLEMNFDCDLYFEIT